jgi:thiosulfate dehydrogenase [quinone] large subunit
MVRFHAKNGKASIEPSYWYSIDLCKIPAVQFQIHERLLFMSANENNFLNDLGLILGMILLRLWLAMRAIQTGIEKFAGAKPIDSTVLIDGVPNAYGLTETTSGKVYALSNYNGVPAPLMDKFSLEPLIPAWGLSLFDMALGPLLIILGLMVFLGLATRASLFIMGLVYTSLTFGLILLKQDAGVAWLGIHVIMIVMALLLSRYNKFAILNKW